MPDLATSWDVSKDQLTYTFHLRDAKFADGTPVTAQDAVWSIERARKLDGGWGFLITAVKSITAPDAKTVVVKLSQPHAPLLADLAMYAYSVLPQKEVEQQGNKFFTHPIGSGPFVSPPTTRTPRSTRRQQYSYGTKPKIQTSSCRSSPTTTPGCSTSRPQGRHDRDQPSNLTPARSTPIRSCRPTCSRRRMSTSS